MITLENLKDYAAIQENSEGKIHYLFLNKRDDGSITLTIDALENCECTLSESEMLDKVEKTLYDFPSATISYADDEQKEIQLNQLKNKVALQTRRGVAKVMYNNVVYYRNNIPNIEVDVDSPIFVLKNGDKYGVYKHPNFDKYGFVVEYEG